MKKILLSLLSIGLLCGCSTTKDSEVEKLGKEGAKEKESYIIDQTKRYDMGLGGYSFAQPQETNSIYSQGGISFLTLKDTKGNEIGVQIYVLELQQKEKEKTSTLEKISDKGSLIQTLRDEYTGDKLSKIEEGFTNLNYEGKSTSSKIGDRDILVYNGIATDTKDKEKQLNYTMVDLFIDEEKTYPCEIIFTNDKLSSDSLETLVKEMITTIQK